MFSQITHFCVFKYLLSCFLVFKICHLSKKLQEEGFLLLSSNSHKAASPQHQWFAGVVLSFTCDNTASCGMGLPYFMSTVPTCPERRV